jgi:hypothetical protein
MTTTPYTKSQILSDFFFRTRNDSNWQEFRSDNVLGLALAWYVTTGFLDGEYLPEVTTEEFDEEIRDTFDNLLKSLGILEDTGFANLDTVLAVAE